MSIIESILRDHPFFAELEHDDIELIAEHSTNVRFEPDTYIFRQGEPANQFYLITYGKVAIEAFSPERGPLTVLTVAEGEVLGWSWLFEPYIWHFDARTVDMTRAIAINGEKLRAQCEQNHELGYQLMRRGVHVVEQRLQAAMIQLLDLYSVQGAV
ncbi:MAG: cyclic nucleotide-binding domain-containing protein [Chloroflexaceae bacterium]|nr:cyclic nucleotide-binding domain-containing protein [Chloroflexaceae bacterium]